MRELTARISSESQDHVVLDMEAGVEHLSRGTTRNTDVLLVVAEPYYKSLETAARVHGLALELGIGRVYTIANKIRAVDAESVGEFVSRHDIGLAAEIPHDESVAEADRLGIAPIDRAPGGIMVKHVRSLVERLLQEG